MADRLGVLISSAGRRAALLRAFRDIDGVEIHACDLRPELSSACMMADMAHAVPRVDAPDFIPAIARIVQEHGIGLIVPTIDTELPAYAGADLGAAVHVSSPETVAIARDKGRTMQVLAQAGVPVPDTVTDPRDGALGWPVFGKPSAGSASRGLGIYAGPGDVPDSFPEPMIFQPVLKGPEYTVNLYIDRAGELRCAIPHLRIQTRAGEVEKGRTQRRPDLRRIADGIAAALPGARGVLCFQVIDDATRGPQVIEINARFGGGYPLAHHAGARFADWLVAETRGEACPAHDNWRDGVTMLRYDDAVFTG